MAVLFDELQRDIPGRVEVMGDAVRQLAGLDENAAGRFGLRRN